MFKTAFFWFCFLLCSRLALAEPDTLFTVSHAPPAGFIEAAEPQRILIDMYYGDKYLGAYNAIVSPTAIKFIHPALFLSKIHGLKNTVLLVQTLKKFSPTNSAAICQNKNSTKTCGVLYPAVIGVIYNPLRFSANIFINPRYLKKPNNSPFKLLPEPTAGWSYSNQVSTIFSGNTNQNTNFSFPETAVTNAAENNYSSITSNSILAYKNNRANLSFSANSPLAGGNQWLLNQADIERDQGRHTYAAGLIQTTGSQFFPNISILGGQFATTLKTMPNALTASATPLIIFINLPSQVSIFKNSQLIYSRFLPAGYQRIDTANFPEGAYQLTVKTVDSQGNTNTRQYYYVKTNQLPPEHFPQYSFTTGYEVVTPQFNSSSSTQLTDVPVYQFNANKRIAENWAVVFNSIGNNKNLYAASGPAWFYGPFSISAGLLTGTQNTYGTSTNLSYVLNKFSAAVNYLQLFNHPSNFQENLSQKSNSYYQLLTPNSKQIDTSVGYAINNNTNLDLIGTYTKTPCAFPTYSYGINVNKTLVQYSSNQLQLNIGATRSNTDYSINASLVLTFSAPTFSATAQTGYLSQHNINSTTAAINNSGLQASGTANWFHTDSDNYGYNVGLHGYHSATSKNLGSTVTDTNQYAMVSAYANYNTNQNVGGTVQYGGEMVSQLNWAPGKTTLSNGQDVNSSGVIVIVKSPEKNSSFIIHTAMSRGFKIKANKPYFIPLAPYHQYDMQISNNSTKNYSFNKQEKLVTIYPGNIQTLTWHALPEIIIIGRLVDKYASPIEDAEITNSLGNSYTDSHGYFQLNLTDTKPKIYAKYGAHSCQLKLPHLKLQSTYQFLGDIKCVSVS